MARRAALFRCSEVCELFVGGWCFSSIIDSGVAYLSQASLLFFCGYSFAQ